jgi:hypothetical protein
MREKGAWLCHSKTPLPEPVEEYGKVLQVYKLRLLKRYRLLAARSKQIAAKLRWLKTECLERMLIAGGGRGEGRMGARRLSAKRVKVASRDSIRGNPLIAPWVIH